MWAVVPLKSPEHAKTRLAGVLSAVQRRQLLFVLAERAIRALHATPGIDGVAVVTASKEVAEFAGRLGAQSIPQLEENGTADAFSSAVRHLKPLALQSLLMIAGDLPLISTEALQQLIARADSQPGVIVVPDRHRLGTNALLCAPPDVMAPHFGNNSFRLHLRAAEASGVAAQVFDLPELTLDLDVADDLEFLRTHYEERAQHLLHALQYSESGALSRRVAGAN